MPDSFTALSDAMAQLAADGQPEAVALLAIARRAVDAAAAEIAGHKCAAPMASLVTIYRRLGDVSRDLVMLRDGLDEVLAVAASSTAPNAKNTRTDATPPAAPKAKRTRKPKADRCASCGNDRATHDAIRCTAIFAGAKS